MKNNYLKLVIASVFTWLFFASGTSQTVISEDFTVCSLPTGWTQVSTSSDVWRFCGSVNFGSTSTILDPSGNSGGYAWLDYSDDPDSTALQTPVVYVGGLTTPELSFWYNSQTTVTTFSPKNQFYVEYWNGSSWVVMFQDSVNTGWTKHTFTLTNALGTFASGDSVQLRFGGHEGGVNMGGTGTNTFSQDMALDQILLRETPSCFTPNSPSATNVTSTSASLGWTANASNSPPVSSWQISYGTTGFTPVSGTKVITSTNPYSLTSITSNTSYSWAVRSICGVGDTSAWSVTNNFTTPCAPYSLPYTEGFESGYTHNTAVGGCISQEDVLGTGAWTANTGALTSYNRTAKTGSSSAFLRYSNTDWMFFPVTLVGGTSYTTEVYAKQDGSTTTNSDVGISYGSTNSAAGMTNTIVAPVGIHDSYQLIKGNFTPSTSGTYYIGIKGYMNGSPWYITIDDISVYATPTLDMKANEGLITSCLVSSTKVYAVIQNNASATINFATNNTVVGASITGQATYNLSTTLTTDSLMPNDTMHVLVGTANMSTNGTYSLKTFTTVTGDGNATNDTSSSSSYTQVSAASLPQKVDFDGFTGSNLPTIHPGWSEANGSGSPTGTSSVWTTGGTYNAFFGMPVATANIYTASDDEWIVSPKMSITASDSLFFSIAATEWNSTSSAIMDANDALNVMISTDCGASWNVFAAFTSTINTPSNIMDAYDYSLSAYAGQDIYLAFYATQGGSASSDIDVHVGDVFIGTPPAKDFGVTAIVDPAAGCGNLATQVKVALYNYGNAPQTNVGVNVNVTGSQTTSLSGTVSSLAAFTHDTIVVGTLNTLTGGTFNLTAFTNLTGDEDHSNDTLSSNGIMIGAIPTAPSAPATIAVCDGADTALIASGGASGYRWYSENAGGTLLSSSDTLSFTNLSTSDTVYVETFGSASSTVGAVDNSIGGGGTYTAFTDGLVFNAAAAFTLDSVDVLVGGAGNVTVRQLTSTNVVQNTVTVSVGSSGWHTIPVGFAVQPGTGLKLDAVGSTVSNHYRNSSGAVYPYTDGSGTVTITNAINNLAGYYYFFYNWKVTVEGCSSDRTASIINVNPNPTVALGSDSAFCGGSAVNMMLDATTTGVTYKWNDNSTNATLAVNAVGTYWARVTTPAGCFDIDSVVVSASAPTTVTFPALATICANAPADTLSGATPIGGIYSGNGVSNGMYDPSFSTTGDDTLIYTFTDTSNCDYADTTVILLDTVPVLSSSSIADICEGSRTFIPTFALPVGGTYSGAAVNNGSFVPDSGIVGMNYIQYAFTDGNNCSDSIVDSVMVNGLPMLSLTVTPQICINEPAFKVSGATPAGGDYSINGVMDSIFTPTKTGIDTVLYTYTDSNNCTSVDSNFVTVDSIPVVTFAAITDPCVGAPMFNLTQGAPAGGRYIQNNARVVSYDPASVQSDTIYYAFTDGNGCSDTTSRTITVHAIPTVTFAALSGVCENSGLTMITGGSPTGGTYSGNGLTGTSFDPSAVGVGSASFTYMYTDANNCSNSATQTMDVHAAPVARISKTTDICDNADPITLTTGLPTGGTYSGTGITGADFTPSTTLIGANSYTYIATNANCSDTVTGTVNVIVSPIFSITGKLEGCGEDSVKLATDAPSTFVFKWSTGDQGSTATALVSGTVWAKVLDPTTSSRCFSFDTVQVTYDVVCAGLDAAMSNSSINYYPNPNNGSFNYSFEGLNGLNAELIIFSANGQVVYSKEIENMSAAEQGVIELDNIDQGIYFIHLNTSKGSAVHRIVVSE